MRITIEEKQATHRRIGDGAWARFVREGFHDATAGDIAGGAEIGTGTLFNYFDAKEAIVGWLAEEAVVKARAVFARQGNGVGLEEELFGVVAAELRPLQ